MTFDFFDGLLPILGIIGIYPAVKRLIRFHTSNTAEFHLRWILTFMTLLFAFRIPYVALGREEYAGIVFAFATAIAFEVFLFFETILRRHMPLALKIWMSVGSLIFVAVSLAGIIGHSKWTSVAFVVFLAVSQLWIIFVCLARDKKDYSAAENRFIRAGITSLVILVPCFITDMEAINKGLYPGLGVLGGLMFTYISIYSESIFNRPTAVLEHIMKALIFSALLTMIVIALIPGQPMAVQSRMMVLFVCVNLIFRIHSTVTHIDGADTSSRFIQALAECRKKNRIVFLSEIDEFYKGVDKKILNAEDLSKLAVPAIIDVFEKRQTVIFGLRELRQARQELESKAVNSQRELDAMEQMIHLLEANRMNSICLMTNEEPIIVLYDLTAIGYSSQVRTQAGLIADIARLIKAVSGTR
jgi:hypothetical protein